MKILSPLTHSSNVTLLKRISTESLIDEWNKQFSIDISNDLSCQKEIFFYKCNDTELLFYHPRSVAGSDYLYEQLSCLDWYYMPSKWEHDIAISDLRNCKKVLEVGCGKGAFVRRLNQEKSIDALGLDFNQEAALSARKDNIPVLSLTLKEMAAEKTSYFDAVCSFQVLEHVPDPLNFIKEMIQLVKPGGKLIIAVPNAKSFLKHDERNLLDQPPHHMTRWSLETFESLIKLVPLHFEKSVIEPLADYHVDWYISTQLSRLPNVRIIKSLAFRFMHKVINPLLKSFSLLRRLVPGHTLYVVFTLEPKT